MLAYYSFERKTIKWWKKLSSHLFDLVEVLRNKTSKKKMSLEILHEKVAKGMLASADTEIQVQGQTYSPAGRFLGRGYSVNRIPATHAKLEGKSEGPCCASANRSKRQTGKTVKK
jgi:hypothetical protein